MVTPYPPEFGNRVVMLGEDEPDSTASSNRGENFTSFVNNFVNKAGDVASAVLTAKVQADSAETPEEQDHWDRVLAVLESRSNQNQAPQWVMPAMIGAGVLVVIALTGRKRR